jgi:2-amino-4-hydroxy-6-hydroxymethyldihydropteridine diphosphokinase
MDEKQMTKSKRAYIALGSNIGDREGTLHEAISRLNEFEGITVLRCSNLYETEPVGYLDQDLFLNMVIAISCELLPEQLLAAMLSLELELGRQRLIVNGPRTIDLDLLWVEGTVMDTPQLILPHPRMFERAFVLVPLTDVVEQDESDPFYLHLRHTLVDLKGKEGVTFWKICNWPSEFVRSEN